MAPPVEVQSEDHWHRLLHNNKKLVLRICSNEEHDERDLFNQSVRDLDVISSCFLDFSCHPELASSLCDAAITPGNATKIQSSWLFFKDGIKVYAATHPVSKTKINRLLAVFGRNPDTFEQIVHQDEVTAGQQKKGSSNRSSTDPLEEDPSDRDVAVLQPALLFVAGDRSQVGKSSTCLGLLGSMIRKGLKASELAYIKPATQCERPQLVTSWCERIGVACRGIGPVIFYKGFTREFLKGGAGTSPELLEEVQEAVQDIGRGKKFVVVDGVGYPAVGSICGVSNGDVAAAIKAPVLLVGRSGVGDAVDSFNLNACFFESRGVRVLGGLFNRLSVEGFYSLERCKEAVTSYFAQAKPTQLPYGFVPELYSLKSSSAKPTTSSATPASPTASKAQVSITVDKPPSNDSKSSWDTKNVSIERNVGPREPMPSEAIETEKDLEAFCKRAGEGCLAVIDFGASWCKNCAAIMPFVEALPEMFRGEVVIASVDVDNAMDLADARGVTVLPHFIFVQDGTEVGQYTGSSESELQRRIDEYLFRPATGQSAESESTSKDSEGTSIGSSEGKEDDPLIVAEALIEAFSSHVDVSRLLQDIESFSSQPRSLDSVRDREGSAPAVDQTDSSPACRRETTGKKVADSTLGVSSLDEGGNTDVRASRSRKSRAEVEAEAAAQEASSG